MISWPWLRNTVPLGTHLRTQEQLLTENVRLHEALLKAYEELVEVHTELVEANEALCQKSVEIADLESTLALQANHVKEMRRELRDLKRTTA